MKNQILGEGQKNWLQILPSPLIHSLRARGFDSSEKIDSLLKFSMKNLKDPFSILGMKEAIERLLLAFERQEHILVYGDYDMDGSSGLAMLVRALRKLGYSKVSFRQAHRHLEGYGLHVPMMDEFNAKGVDLILTVDVGITAREACERAKALGIDVIITDHHLAQEEKFPSAISVVNPNQAGDTSGLGYLCGAGVAFYLLRALKRSFHNQGWDHGQYDLRESLPFFLLATLTDMVPLVEDNRILVRHGLENFPLCELAGIKALRQQVLPDRKRVSTSDVAIQFAPKLNALTRMDCDLKPVDILLEDDPLAARKLSQRILEINEERTREQKRAEELADAVSKDEGFFFYSSEEIHLGVVGLVATRMCQKWGVPSFIAAKNEHGLMVGSGRAPEGSSLVQILQKCESALLQFGGHDLAAGFQYSKEKEDELRERMKKVFREERSEGNALSNSISIGDLSSAPEELQNLHHLPRPQSLGHLAADLSPDEVNMQLCDWVELFEPFGKSFESFLFQLKSIQVMDRVLIKGRHLKLQIQLNAKSSSLWTAWMFSPSPEMISILDSFETFDCICEIQRNEFRGRESLQFIIRELKGVLK